MHKRKTSSYLELKTVKYSILSFSLIVFLFDIILSGCFFVLLFGFFRFVCFLFVCLLNGTISDIRTLNHINKIKQDQSCCQRHIYKHFLSFLLPKFSGWLYICLSAGIVEMLDELFVPLK